MKHFIPTILQLHQQPKRGLLPLEWAVLGYILVTFMIIGFNYAAYEAPIVLIMARIQAMAIILTMWGVYRLRPCRLTLAMRIIIQMAMLAWWYPDTYELNRVLPNLDHHFALWEQSLFGMQPALTFVAMFPSPIVSELMSMGYAAFYPMIALTALYYLFAHHDQFERCTFILITSFFLYYIIYDLLPVVGPTFYFHAVGLENIKQGIFPSLGNYFNTHHACLSTPGYQNGLFYHLVEDAKAAGERPTAAFPSSHVGIATICMLLFWHIRNWKMLMVLAPLYLFLCLATVYIQAHYVIDSIAGLITGIAFFALLTYLTRHLKPTY